MYTYIYMHTVQIEYNVIKILQCKNKCSAHSCWNAEIQTFGNKKYSDVYEL